MRKKVLYAIAKSRLFVSRLFGALIILLLLFTGHSFKQGEVVDISFEISGLLLITICSFGRLWSLMYISGYKSNSLITDGPYSIMRHPLYFFSFIGAIGIGLASENVLILGLIIGFYVFYYPFTILAEEEKLTEKFGQNYIEYIKKVPRFLPKLSLYKEPQFYNVTIGNLVRNFVEAMLLIWAYILMHFIEMLQDAGVLPVLLRVP
jgi:protein-S-isoprenylcysteine O-methyltransferase Ste14